MFLSVIIFYFWIEVKGFPNFYGYGIPKYCRTALIAKIVLWPLFLKNFDTLSSSREEIFANNPLQARGGSDGKQ